jgi:hypothetical protein
MERSGSSIPVALAGDAVSGVDLSSSSPNEGVSLAFFDASNLDKGERSTPAIDTISALVARIAAPGFSNTISSHSSGRDTPLEVVLLP